MSLALLSKAKDSFTLCVFRTPHHRYAEPLPLEKPQWVCAYYELASNKVLRSRFLFNAKREDFFEVSPTGISGNFSQFCRVRRPRRTAQLKSICFFIVAHSPSTASGPPPSQMEAQIVQRKKRGFFVPLLCLFFNGRRNASRTGLYLLREEQAPPLPLRSKNFTHEVNFTLTKSKFHCKMTCRFACFFLIVCFMVFPDGFISKVLQPLPRLPLFWKCPYRRSLHCRVFRRRGRLLLR